MSEERWLPVVGYEGLYEVSDQGRVRSVDRVVKYKDGRQRFWPSKILKPYRMPNGYLRFTPPGTHAYIHRAVLEAFVGPCPDGMEACHNDSDRSNNHVTNLRWDTRYGNCQDIKSVGSHANTQKDRCPEGHIYDGLLHGPAMKAAGLGPRRYCKTCKNQRERERYAGRSLI